MMLEQERAERQLHQQQVLEVEQHLRQEKQKQKNELIDDLVNDTYLVARSLRFFSILCI